MAVIAPLSIHISKTCLSCVSSNGSGIQIDAMMERCRTETCDTFNNPPLCPSTDFIPAAVEVFGLQWPSPWPWCWLISAPAPPRELSAAPLELRRQFCCVHGSALLFFVFKTFSLWWPSQRLRPSPSTPPPQGIVGKEPRRRISAACLLMVVGLRGDLQQRLRPSTSEVILFKVTFMLAVVFWQQSFRRIVKVKPCVKQNIKTCKISGVFVCF